MTEQDLQEMHDDAFRLIAAVLPNPAEKQFVAHLSTGSVILTWQELHDRYWKLQATIARSR